MSDRYIIYNGSRSGHCCFTATVMDSTKPIIIDGKHYEDSKGKHYETVCECLYLEDAIRIANTLNAAEPTKIEFTDKELQRLIVSTYSRATKLLDMSIAMTQRQFTWPSGRAPTNAERDKTYELYEDHLDLVDKLRDIRSNYVR